MIEQLRLYQREGLYHRRISNAEEETMEDQIKIINIMWEGPFRPEDAYEKNEESSDYGVYQ